MERRNLQLESRESNNLQSRKIIDDRIEKRLVGICKIICASDL
jgi:hypothetical protein